MNTVNQVRILIQKEYEGKSFNWKEHIEDVVKYSKLLSRQLDADEEICEIAAWLHDIDKIRGGKEGHHIKGAEEASEILRKLGYPESKIKKVHDCILTHSSDKNYIPETIEAKIVASADILSHFENPLFEVYIYFQKGLSISETKEKLLKNIDKNWDKLELKGIPEAKKIAKPKYDTIKILLK